MDAEETARLVGILAHETRGPRKKLNRV